MALADLVRGVEVVADECVGEVAEENDHDGHGAAAEERGKDAREDQGQVAAAGEAELGGFINSDPGCESSRGNFSNFSKHTVFMAIIDSVTDTNE